VQDDGLEALLAGMMFDPSVRGTLEESVQVEVQTVALPVDHVG
jgi:hypothetical protein